MDDEKIIELFFERDQRAIGELDAKYGRICHRISYNILNNSQDADECVNDAYLGVWNTVPPEKPDPLLTYVLKIVRNISLKEYHRKSAVKRNSQYTVAFQEIEDCISDKKAVEDEVSAVELTHVIESFLDTLTRENRVVFMRRYWFSESLSEISRLTGLTEKNISVRLTRIRQKMRKYLIERGVLI